MTLEHKPVNAAGLPVLATDVPESSACYSLLAEMLKENPDLYVEIQASRVGKWRKLVRTFEENPDDFHSAWHYLNEHPLFWSLAGTRAKPAEAHEKYLVHENGFPHALDIFVMKVDPKTRRVEDDESRNTKTEVWYEICMTHWPSQYDDVRVHAWQIDGGGETYEEAIVKAAQQVHETYGNDRTIFDKETP